MRFHIYDFEKYGVEYIDYNNITEIFKIKYFNNDIFYFKVKIKLPSLDIYDIIENEIKINNRKNKMIKIINLNELKSKQYKFMIT
jgi:hypothetical protein